MLIRKLNQKSMRILTKHPLFLTQQCKPAKKSFWYNCSNSQSATA